jgi:hypothetical protein
MDYDTARILGGVFIALAGAMPEQASESAIEILRDVANSPKTRERDRQILHAIANCTMLREEPGLEVITGGAA